MSQTGTGGGGRGGRYLRAFALLLVAGGLAVVAGSGWQWLGKVRHAKAEQVRLDRELDRQWGGTDDPAPAGATAQAARARSNAARANPARQAPASGGGPAAVGNPIARLHLPTLGLALVVLEGAGDAQLSRAPGHLPNTHAFGAPGNAVVAAHRYPGLFWNLDRLAAGDPVVVETADSWHVYRVVRTVIVQPADETVLAPPAAGAPPLLSLATCEPKLSTAQRLVKQAELVRSDARDGARPRELQATERQR